MLWRWMLVVVVVVVSWLNLINSNIILNNYESDEIMELDSFDIFPVTLPSPDINQLLIKPNLNEQCQLELESNQFQNDHNHSYTSIMMELKYPCIDASQPITNFDDYSKGMIKLGYPPIRSVLWMTIPGVRMALLNPESSLPPILSYTKLNITYQVITTTILTTSIHPNSTITIINRSNPWSQLLTTPNNFTWTVAFQVLKFLLTMTQVILCAFVAARSMFKSHLQIGLLAVGFLQLGGELVLTWSDSSYLVLKLYSAIMLLPSCLVNSLVVLSWCNMVWRLRTSVKVKKFRIGVRLESFALMLSILLMISLLITSHYWIGNQSEWFPHLMNLSLFCIIAIPVGMLGWFFYQARQFCPIFHATAKLINAQWFTLFILFTRLFFIFQLVSYHLIILHTTTPHRYLSYNIMFNIATITYNVMIIATVLKMQSIHAVQHRWTPEQLGLVTLDDGSVIAVESNNSSNSQSSNDSDGTTVTTYTTTRRPPTTLTQTTSLLDHHTNPFEKRHQQ